MPTLDAPKQPLIERVGTIRRWHLLTALLSAIATTAVLHVTGWGEPTVFFVFGAIAGPFVLNADLFRRLLRNRPWVARLSAAAATAPIEGAIGLNNAHPS